MKNLTLVLIAVLLFGCNNSSKVLSEKEFAKVYLDSLKHAYPDVEFTLIDKLTISGNNKGNEAKHFLDNAYNDYKSQPQALAQVISRYISSCAVLYGKSREIQINRIIPVLKPADYLAGILKVLPEDSVKAGKLQMVYENYNDDLVIFYAEDMDNGIRYLAQSDLKRLNIAHDTLLSISLRNLNAILPEVQRLGNNGMYALSAGGNYESSLLLMSTLWTKENFQVDGDLVIVVPNRDLVMITGSNNKKEIERISKIAQDSYKNGNYPVSPYLYRWNGHKFERYE